MAEIERHRNNGKLIEMVNFLQLQFPVAEISERLGVDKGNISSYLNNKKSVSNKFLDKFIKEFNIDKELFKNNESSKKVGFFTTELIDELFRSEYFKGRLAGFISDRLNTDNDNVEIYRNELKDVLKMLKKEKV